MGDGVCEEKLLGPAATCVQTCVGCVQTCVCCRKCAPHTSHSLLLRYFVWKRSQQEKRLPLWARVARVKAPSLASFSASTISVIRNAAAFASTVREQALPLHRSAAAPHVIPLHRTSRQHQNIYTTRAWCRARMASRQSVGKQEKTGSSTHSPWFACMWQERISSV